VGALREGLNARDFDGIRTIGHHLKGAGGGYGFAAITDIGARIEKAAAARDDRTVALCIDEFAAYLAGIEVIYT
jgi:HPt (histidine-containing phosphotransfer) domain-containing protein